jgi:hypothetical protein
MVAKKTLRIGENGVREDLIVSLDVDKFFPKIYQMQPITPIVLIDEKPFRTDTQCVSERPRKLSALFPHTHLIA